MQLKMIAGQLLIHVGICLLVASLFYMPVHAQDKDQDVFGTIPVSLRARLKERLNLLIEYQRTQQWDKQYDLFSPLFTQGTSRDIYVRREARAYAKGYGNVLVDFTPKGAIEQLSSANNGWWILDGCTGLYKEGRTQRLYGAVNVYWHDGDWYFSNIGVVTPIDGNPKPCPFGDQLTDQASKPRGAHKAGRQQIIGSFHY